METRRVRLAMPTKQTSAAGGPPLGVRLASARRASGLSQSQVARLMRPPCHVRTVSKIERGVLNPSLEWLYEFARVVGVDPHELDDRLTPPNASPPERLRKKREQAVRYLHEDDGWDKAMDILLPLAGLRKPSHDFLRNSDMPVADLSEIASGPFTVPEKYR